jgi:hypothetical protein
LHNQANSTPRAEQSLIATPRTGVPIRKVFGPRDSCLLTARFASRLLPRQRIASWMTTERMTLVAANCLDALLEDSPMSRHNVSHQKTFLIGVFLLVTNFSSGQTTTPTERFSFSALHAPVLFATVTQTALPPIFDSQLGVKQLRFPIYSRTTLPEIHPTLAQPSKRSQLVRYRFTTAVPPLSNGNNWMGSFANNAAPLAPTYGTTSYQKPHRPPASTEQYVRHIPTAGPMVIRIYQEAKAHPRFTKVVSMFRPDP